MKNILFTSALYIFAMSACNKERTCVCKITEKVTTVTTPRSAGSPSTTVQEYEGTNSFSYPNIKKSDMKRYFDCQTKSATTVNSGTATILVTKAESVNGFTLTSTKAEVADYSRSRDAVTSCEIK
jgi:hypothetical protein